MARIIRRQFHQDEEKDMSLELIKMELKLDPETIAMLRAESKLTGEHQNGIVRQVMKKWAQAKVHASNVMDRELKLMGLPGVSRVFEEDQE